MSIFDILDTGFLDDLPDDPRMAFGQIVERATQYLRDQRREMDETEGSSWDEYRGAEHMVMNVLIASAKRLEIEPFASMQVPLRGDFRSDDFVQFRSDLDHYITQIMLDNSIRSRRESVPVDAKAKEKIRKYLNAIRTQIDEAEMSEGKRAALMAKLAQFEAELGKSRIPIFALARVLVEILSISCNVLALSDSQTFQRLVSQAFHAVAEVKAFDDDQRQFPPSDPPKALMPPRSPSERRKAAGTTASYDLNDDIPF